MYARSTLLEIDTVRVSLDEALEAFKTIVVPRLQEQPGFLGCYALSTPEGKAMTISFWETEDQAHSGYETGFYSKVLEEMTTLFRSPPGRDHYEVLFALPPVAVGSTT